MRSAPALILSTRRQGGQLVRERNDVARDQARAVSIEVGFGTEPVTRLDVVPAAPLPEGYWPRMEDDAEVDEEAASGDAPETPPQGGVEPEAEP